MLTVDSEVSSSKQKSRKLEINCADVELIIKMRSNIWISVILLCCLLKEYYVEAQEGSSFESPDIISKKEVNRDADGFCTYEERKKKLVTVTVPYTETETYYGRCRGYYFKKCLNERLVTKSRLEQQVQEYTDTVRRCCDGYAEILEEKCLPICVHGCVFGNCTSPNTCTCYDGYKPTEKEVNVCEPACTGCDHGTCIASHVCQCNPGYNWDTENGVCVPVCTGNCQNGNCIAPEKCECNEGFTHHPTHSICIPHCNETCIHGQCIAPNTCECDFEHQFLNGSQSICEPICEMSCKNAKCVEPNVCECHNGYIVLDDNKPHECHCGLYCVEIENKCHCLDETQRVSGDQIRNNISLICTNNTCINGVCLSPYECDCYDGFEKDANDNCVSVNETCIDDLANCNGTDPLVCNCINGICSSNHTCYCVNGFTMSDGRNDLCEPHCTKQCVNGFCINPDSCECNTGYRLGYNESQSHICHPICNPDAEDNNGCINGTCIAPDTCQCHEGFQLDLFANYTCVPKPFDAEMQKSGMHWVYSGIIPLIVFIVSLTLASYFIHKRKNRRYNVPKRDDEAHEPITAYLNEEM